MTTSKGMAALILSPVARSLNDAMRRLGLEPDPEREAEDDPWDDPGESGTAASAPAQLSPVAGNSRGFAASRRHVAAVAVRGTAQGLSVLPSRLWSDRPFVTPAVAGAQDDDPSIDHFHQFAISPDFLHPQESRGISASPGMADVAATRQVPPMVSEGQVPPGAVPAAAAPHRDEGVVVELPHRRTADHVMENRAGVSANPVALPHRSQPLRGVYRAYRMLASNGEKKVAGPVAAGHVALRAAFDAAEAPGGGQPFSGVTAAATAMPAHVPLPGRSASGAVSRHGGNAAGDAEAHSPAGGGISSRWGGDATRSAPSPLAASVLSPQRSALPLGVLPLRLQVSPPAPVSPPIVGAVPQPAVPAAAFGGPSSLPHVAGRVGRAMEPLVDRAAAMTEAALAGGTDGDEAFPDGEGAASLAPSQAQVSNTFNVTVNLDASRPDAAAERENLQDALSAILLDAARRQGLDL